MYRGHGQRTRSAAITSSLGPRLRGKRRHRIRSFVYSPSKVDSLSRCCDSHGCGGRFRCVCLSLDLGLGERFVRYSMSSSRLIPLSPRPRSVILRAQNVAWETSSQAPPRSVSTAPLEAPERIDHRLPRLNRFWRARSARMSTWE